MLMRINHLGLIYVVKFRLKKTMLMLSNQWWVADLLQPRFCVGVIFQNWFETHCLLLLFSYCGRQSAFFSLMISWLTAGIWLRADPTLCILPLTIKVSGLCVSSVDTESLTAAANGWLALTTSWLFLLHYQYVTLLSVSWSPTTHTTLPQDCFPYSYCPGLW